MLNLDNLYHMCSYKDVRSIVHTFFDTKNEEVIMIYYSERSFCVCIYSYHSEGYLENRGFYKKYEYENIKDKIYNFCSKFTILDNLITPLSYISNRCSEVKREIRIFKIKNILNNL